MGNHAPAIESAEFVFGGAAEEDTEVRVVFDEGTNVVRFHAILNSEEEEAKVLQALESADFPVPHLHGMCTDDAVIGTWFYVMDYVHGRVLWDATFPDVSRDERPRYFDAINETLARLHSVDYRSYIPQVEDTIWREFRCQSGGQNAPPARRVAGATDAANP